MNKISEKKIPALSRDNMDTTVNPGDDFVKFANGGWMKNNPIPPDKSIYGAFHELQELNNTQLKTIMDEAVKGSKSTNPIWNQIGDFYAAGMDTVKIEKEGYNPLKPYLEAVDKISDIKSLNMEMALLHSIGIGNSFVMYSAPDEKNSNMTIANLMQAGLSLGDRDYYLSDDARSKEIRTEYVKFMNKMFALVGYSQADAEKASASVLELETKIAKFSRTRVALRDPQTNYNKMPFADLKKLTSDFDWDGYFKTLEVPAPAEINVGQPDFFTAYGKLLKETPIDTWKTYLKWNIIDGSASTLSSNFVTESFNFHGKVMVGKEQQEPRWKRILYETSGSLGEAVGQLYVEKFFPAESKKKMTELVGNLKIALGDRIKKLEWMSEVTKKEAIEKLDRIKVKIGYPDKWIDYSSLKFQRGNFSANVIAANKFNIRRELDKIGKPVDRTEWGMSPQTVNAYYSPNMNEIVFPAAILQPPFFNKDADDPVNYAGIGTVIGHELTHGFDDQGRQYDKEGNLRDWWTKEDAEKFTQHVSVIEEQYNNFVAIDTFKVNGKLTLGENIADLGGITVSWEAWKLATKGKESKEKIDGFTPEQRFFISYATVWRNNVRDKELMRRLKMDVHSPARFRILGVLPNVDKWYEAFNIKPTDKMYIAPEKRAKVW